MSCTTIHNHQSNLESGRPVDRPSLGDRSFARRRTARTKIGMCASVAAFVLASVAGTPSQAASYNRTQRLTLAVNPINVPNPPVLSIPSRVFAHAFAADKHDSDLQDDFGNGDQIHIRDRQGRDVRINNELRNANTGNGTPQSTYSPRPKWRHTNPQANLNAVQLNAPPTTVEDGGRQAASVHPNSEAKYKITLQRLPSGPPLPVNPAKDNIEAILHVEGVANAPPPPADHADETDYAQAASGAQVQVKGSASVLEEWDNRDAPSGQQWRPVVNYRHHGTAWVGPTGASSERRTLEASTTDPLVMRFFDTSTETLLGESTIFQDLWETVGNARIDWAEGGNISLMSTQEGSAFLQLMTPSPWVTNPLNGTVSIEGGIFNATGDFANLPWVVTDLNGVVTAVLPESALAHDFTFVCDVSQLPDSMGDVRIEVESDLVGRASELNSVVPAPGAFALFAIGVFAVVRRRR